jgi:hypothetical protein
VAEFIFEHPAELVEEVVRASAGLPYPPLRRTALGCLKVLGDRFGGVTKTEILVATVAVQTWITLQKKG